jgi:bla regulator protein BlaR1
MLFSMVNRRSLLVALLALAAPLSSRHQAQVLHANGPLPSFEVATIKPMQGAPPPPPGGAPPPLPHDQILLYVNVRQLIASAYNVQAFAKSEILGGPAWTNDQLYEIHAKISGPMSEAMQKMRGKDRQEQTALMEQSLLTDRFKLHVHFEARDLPQFELGIVKGGHRLPAATPSAPQRISLETPHPGEHTLASLLQDQPEIGGRLIVDKTSLEWELQATSVSMLTALTDQLGLRLIESNGPIEVLVIDSIDRPSEN